MISINFDKIKEELQAGSEEITIKIQRKAINFFIVGIYHKLNEELLAYEISTGNRNNIIDQIEQLMVKMSLVKG